jgi:Beta-galactosidase
VARRSHLWSRPETTSAGPHIRFGPPYPFPGTRGWFSSTSTGGYALITTVPGVAQSHQRGVARLNTGKFRRAVFQFDKASFESPVRVEGVEFLRSVSIESLDNRSFARLEHGKRVDIQTIFCGHQDRYVRRFLQEFGKHYGPRKALLGVRLGPRGNYGEAQYPARGDWGYKDRPIHTHIGYWAGDACAAPAFQKWLRLKYAGIGDLNRAWGDSYESFELVKPFLPETAATLRKRIDFADWYKGSMSRLCEQWAEWAREAMPQTVIHQSSGGWGPIEIGTDYTHHARTMARLKGGVRLTNESDNFPQNFAITRMASSAARFYGAALGYEP